jgi:hypothetical protein
VTSIPLTIYSVNQGEDGGVARRVKQIKGKEMRRSEGYDKS